MFSKMALGGIWAYQQYLSPNKGFRCAHSVHHGGTGCSGYAKHAIRDQGLWRALPDIRQRFRDCRAAYYTIKDNCTCSATPTDDNKQPLSQSENEELERRRQKDNRCCSKGDMCIGCGEACSGARIASCGGGGRVAGGSTSSSGPCDLNPCDGDIGCNSCDACSCDICSCG